MYERKILYYPTIVIPRRWINHTILYWDKICSISPKIWEDVMEDEVFSALERDSGFQIMKVLKEQGYYEPIYPKAESECTGKHFNEEFEFILRSEKFRRKLNYNWKQFLPKNWEDELQKYPELYYFSGRYSHIRDEIIYALKSKSSRNIERSLASDLARHIGRVGIVQGKRVGDNIINLLESLDLALEISYQPNWYFMEGYAALLYGALLAKHLADEDPEHTIISTDWREYESMLFETSDRAMGFPSLSAKFLDLLPVPREEVKIEDIIKFKNKRESELLAFREVFNEMEKDISNAKDKREIKRILTLNKEKIKKEVHNIRKLMKESNLEIAMASFKSLIDIKQPALWTALASSFFASASTIPLAGALAIIQVGSTWIDKRNELNAKLRSSPYSYLYYVEEEKVFK